MQKIFLLSHFTSDTFRVRFPCWLERHWNDFLLQFAIAVLSSRKVIFRRAQNSFFLLAPAKCCSWMEKVNKRAPCAWQDRKSSLSRESRCWAREISANIFWAASRVSELIANRDSASRTFKSNRVGGIRKSLFLEAVLWDQKPHPIQFNAIRW